MHGRLHVSVKDIQALAKPILRHRIIPNFYAEAEGISPERIIERLHRDGAAAEERAVAKAMAGRDQAPLSRSRRSSPGWARIDLKAKTIVEGFLTGLHRSPFKGFSVEFAEYRQYLPGDDLATLDWKIYARTDRHVVKKFEEETNLECHILLDVSRSMGYGSHARHQAGVRVVPRRRARLPDEPAARRGRAAHLRRPRSASCCRRSARPGHLKSVLLALERLALGSRTDVAKPLGDLVQAIRKRGLVVLISDLLDEPGSRHRGLEALPLPRHRRHRVPGAGSATSWLPVRARGAVPRRRERPARSSRCRPRCATPTRRGSTRWSRTSARCSGRTASTTHCSTRRSRWSWRCCRTCRRGGGRSSLGRPLLPLAVVSARCAGDRDADRAAPVPPPHRRGRGVPGRAAARRRRSSSSAAAAARADSAGAAGRRAGPAGRCICATLPCWPDRWPPSPPVTVIGGGSVVQPVRARRFRARTDYWRPKRWARRRPPTPWHSSPSTRPRIRIVADHRPGLVAAGIAALACRRLRHRYAAALARPAEVLGPRAGEWSIVTDLQQAGLEGPPRGGLPDDVEVDVKRVEASLQNLAVSPRSAGAGAWRRRPATSGSSRGTAQVDADDRGQGSSACTTVDARRKSACPSCSTPRCRPRVRVGHRGG